MIQHELILPWGLGAYAWLPLTGGVQGHGPWKLLDFSNFRTCKIAVFEG